MRTPEQLAALIAQFDNNPTKIYLSGRKDWMMIYDTIIEKGYI